MRNSTAAVFFCVFFLLLVSFLWLGTAYLRPTIDVNDYVLPSTDNKQDALYAYWIVTKYDPILALPGTNLTELAASIDALEDSIRPILPYYTDEEQRLISDHLYPLIFLKTLPDTEKARRIFANTPTKEHATAYHHALLQSLKAYRKNATGLQKALMTIPDKTLAFLDGKTSTAFVITQLERAQEHIEVQIHTENERYACFSKNRVRCQSLRENTLINEVVSDYKQPSPEKSVYEYANILHRYTTNNEDNTLPLVAVKNAACFQYEDTAYYYTWATSSRMSNMPLLRLTPANDMLFYDTSNLLEQPFYRKMYENEVRYSFQPVNTYMCVNAVYDSGITRTAHAIQKHLQHFTPLKNNQSQYQQLQEHVSDITQQTDILYNNSIEQLVASIPLLLHEESEANIVSNIGREQYLQLRDTVLLWRSQSADLEKEFALLDDMTVTTLHVLPTMSIPIEPLFLTRSYIATLYLFNNKTLFDEPISLTSISEATSLDNYGLLSHKNDLQEEIPFEQIPSLIESLSQFNNREWKDIQSKAIIQLRESRQ